MATKVCKKCGEEKRVEDFQLSRHGTRFAVCRECVRSIHLLRHSGQQATAIRLQAKACSKCKEVKPFEDFHKHPEKLDGRTSNCKACVHARVTNRYRTDATFREKSNALSKEYSKALRKTICGWAKAQHRAYKCKCRNNRTRYELTPKIISSLFPANGMCPITKRHLIIGDGYSKDSPAILRNNYVDGYVIGNVRIVSLSASVSHSKRQIHDGKPRPTHKNCKICGDSKTVDSFYAIHQTAVDGTRRPTLKSICTACVLSILRANTAIVTEENNKKKDVALAAEKTRVCKSCQMEKPIERFALFKKNIGRSLRCKKCVKHKWRSKPETIIKIRESQRVYRNNKRKTPEGWCKSSVGCIRSRCKAAGIHFNLTYRDLLAVWPTDGKCPALGIPLLFGRINGDNCPSVDRTDPTKGYVPGNIGIISLRANRIKFNANAEEIDRVATYTKMATCRPESSPTS